jgi:DNA-binding CsgD family transcriptional regulator
MVSEDQMRTREAAMLAYDLDEKSDIDAETSVAFEFDLGGQVARAGLPVLERLAEDLGDLAVSIVLTDADANVLGSVQGDDHPAGARAEIAYVTAPIADPRRDSPVGSVGIKGATAEVGALMLPYAQLAARTIAERVLDGAAVADRALVEHFLRARRRARGPVVAVNENEVLANAAAARLVEAADHLLIWDWASSLLERNDGSAHDLHLRARTVNARCEPILVRGDLVGALVYVEESKPVPTTGPRPRVRGSRRPTWGWSSLRSSELGIAALVADGLTNREVAARLFVSPHTVDFHLRQIFRKLSITSRIELTRLVVENANPNAIGVGS